MWPLFTLLSAAAAALLFVLWLRTQRRLGNALSNNRLLRGQLEMLEKARSEEVTLERTRQKALFDSMLEGVLVLDADHHVRLANESLLRLFGVGDITGRSLIEALRLQELVELARRVAAAGSVEDLELELPTLEGRFFQINGASFDTRQGRNVILVFHDITRLRQLENTRREFVANVSHELRTPLSLIKGYVETLIDGARDDPSVALKFLRTIEKHADRLTYLIEDLLTLSRLESGRLALNLQNVPLRAAVQRTIDDMQLHNRGKTMTFVNDVPADLAVRADGDRVQQVLFNLIDNAIKYGRPAVSVTVGARAAGEGRVAVSVRDNGPGIAPEHLPRIFERFYRVDKARSRDQGGTGLGLAIIKHIVQSHGGEVTAASEPGNGATFEFTLPRATGEARLD